MATQNVNENIINQNYYIQSVSNLVVFIIIVLVFSNVLLVICSQTVKFRSSHSCSIFVVIPISRLLAGGHQKCITILFISVILSQSAVTLSTHITDVKLTPSCLINHALINMLQAIKFLYILCEYQRF